jgi:hypothetical protein
MYSATKMVLYATVIPFEIGENVQLTLSQEIIKTLIYMTETIFLFQSLKSKNNFTDKQSALKIITIGLGWSLADSLFSNLFYYLMNSMGEEFTWEYIRTAILANLQMIEKMAIIALIQSVQKLMDDNKAYMHIIILIIIKYLFNSFAYNYIPQLNFEGDQWKILMSKIAITVIFGLAAKKIFRNSNKTEDEMAEEEYLKMKKKTQ